VTGVTARPARTVRRALPAAAIAVTGATIAAGLLLNHFGVFLGTALPPFWMHWAPLARPLAHPLAHPWLLAGAGVAVVLIAAAPWALTRAPAGLPFAALAYGGSLAFGLAVNAARLGPAGWDHVFLRGRGGSYEARYEYLPALRLLHRGVAKYVHEYPQLLPYLPTHAKGNPPGPVVLMHLLGISDAARLSAVCIGVGALCAPLAYALGRELGATPASSGASTGESTGESRGRRAALLTAFSPAVVLFGVTSADYAFAALGTGCAWLLVSRSPARRAAGTVLAALASFFSWVLLAIPVWAVIVVLRRDGWRAALLTAAAAAGAIAAFTGLLALVWGYDPVAVIRALQPIYDHGEAVKRPYAFWVFGSPTAFLAILGVPIAWLALRSLARGEPAALALGAVIAVAAIAGFSKAETERIWLPFVPLACVAAATLIPPRRMPVVLAALAAQAIAIEVLFATVW
jgi:hypothetical protein